MATTTFGMVLGARLVLAAFAEGRISTFSVSAGPLMAADPYGSTRFSRSGAATAKAWLPPESEPWFDPKTGKPTPQFARFMHYLANQRLGGIDGPSMGEVQTNVQETKAAAVQAVLASSAVEDMATANAEALKATVQVTQTAALPGATQIPDVIVRTAYKRNLDNYL
jgi:hypothetical protein